MSEKMISMSTLTTRTDDIRRDTARYNESSTPNRRSGISQYRLIEDVEDLDRYHPGGYHLRKVGDELDNVRRRMINKLKYTKYSTIWLARDLQKAQYVAVKVITADASVCTPGRGVIPLLQPPEARFSDEPLSFASDIWTLACTIWEIVDQRPLFETFFPAADRVTTEQVEVLGILPPEWWEKWSRRLDWFNEEGELNVKPEMSVRRALCARFEYSIQAARSEAGLETMTVKERRAFEVMLQSMLIYRPNERATAQQALHSEWIKNWGNQLWNRAGVYFHKRVMRRGVYPGEISNTRMSMLSGSE
ncbi:hypothetical protein N7517_006058 [Penicillium concentricum]|uniref:non-specific serine/threonine protein kinase n=1 Tax=Penicillium concentricum TaxID=293559 RepID=A0A9W9V9S0_9EURO|nr:uncharacterized protein N7517_006058 [Penicillium concentricum]KAJ5374052.1 hypothetical protein N7517_006058 [Penicillium concentricum]